MMVWLGYGYARLLLALELLLLTASLVLHVSMFLMGRTTAYDESGLILFRAVVIVGVATVAFVKDGQPNLCTAQRKLPSFNKALRRGSQTSTCCTWGLSRS
jgi:hypothetical protein